MATEPKGAYNREPIFTGGNYGHWKACVDNSYRVSHCETAKAMWDALEVSHEATNKVKARINTLNQELSALGKTIFNVIATNKVLRCLNREWKPKVTVIKEKHEKEYEKKMKKEKGKGKEEVNKSIALKPYSFKSSKNEASECEERDDNNSGDDDVGLFAKRYQRYIQKNKVKHSEGNLSKFRRESKSSQYAENIKDKFISSCYNFGEIDHYRTKCTIIKKDKERGHHKKSSTSRRSYVACASVSDSSSDESFTSSVESSRICLMASGRKKKQVSPSKHDLTSDLSYSKLQDAFYNLHREALNAFKKLASHEKIFLKLEAKVECLESTKKMWYLDSGCSRHMTGDIPLFIDFVPKKKGFFTYGDNNKRAILGKGSVGNPSSTTISDVMLVDGLKHNLLSISQLCDKGYFLGTIAKNADFCPLIYTNFKELLKDEADPKCHNDRIWKYINTKFNIPERGKKAVFSRINDAWRRNKYSIKRDHFLKYSSMKERLKNRPKSISEYHFKKLLVYWKDNHVQFDNF
ncbi:uncharacterized protein LOC127102702 [Lathyrus oleraceus]|uniref:uncharacterized protein LOC127102702 n=1 Tax=Pisum sativum TaxID=3888 RepID=UPI0021D26A1C|nr:uncharacterized protein LOC127102702 [Pisum sativum]